MCLLTRMTIAGHGDVSSMSSPATTTATTTASNSARGSPAFFLENTPSSDTDDFRPPPRWVFFISSSPRERIVAESVCGKRSTYEFLNANLLKLGINMEQMQLGALVLTSEKQTLETVIRTVTITAGSMTGLYCVG